MAKKLEDLKQPFNIYLKYSTILAIKEESKKSNRTQSEIIQTLADEYIEKHNLLKNGGTA